MNNSINLGTIEKQLNEHGYYNVTLATVKGLSLKDISRDEFVKTMKIGLETASARYEELTGEPQNDRLRMFFQIWPGPHHGVPGVCHGLRNDSTDEELSAAYDALIKNEWFLKGNGIRFTYDGCSNGSLHCCSFGTIEVLMNDKDKADEIAGQKAIDDDIARFYANCRYCGD